MRRELVLSTIYRNNSCKVNSQKCDIFEKTKTNMQLEKKHFKPEPTCSGDHTSFFPSFGIMNVWVTCRLSYFCGNGFARNNVSHTENIRDVI